MTTTTQNWMGINFSFDKVADERSKGTSFVGIQQCGRHKAELKNLYFSLHGEKNTPALTAVFELEESGKEHIESLWMTKMDDDDSVNKKKIKNLISTILYSDLTEKEFEQLERRTHEKVMEFYREGGKSRSDKPVYCLASGIH